MTTTNSNDGGNKDKKNKNGNKKNSSKKEIAKASYNSLIQLGTQTGLNDISISLRTGLLFDTQKQRQRKPEYYENIVSFFGNFFVFVSRQENTIQYQRIFESILTIGKIQIKEKSAILEIENMYQLKKLAGLSIHTSDAEIIRIAEEISKINVKIIAENEEEKNAMTFRLLGNVISKIDKTTNKSKSFKIILDPGFIYAIETVFTIIRIDEKTLKYIHQHVKSPYVEKLIKLFLTQEKPAVFKQNNFWSLLKTSCDFLLPSQDMQTNEYNIDKLSERQKRRIVAEIETECDLLSKFGIEFNRKEQQITYNPQKNTYKNTVKIRYSSI
jgi:hypothetical protein